MKTTTIAIRAALVLAFIVGCNGDKPLPQAPGPTPGPTPVDNSTAINQFMAGLPRWDNNVDVEQPDNTLAPVRLVERSGTVNTDDGSPNYMDYSCPLTGTNVTGNWLSILAPNRSPSVLYPGALVHGSGFTSGRLELIPLARAPLTLSITPLALANTSVVIPNPNSVTVGQAVADFKTAAFQELGQEDAIPADIGFIAENVSSLDQAYRDLGISVEYKNDVNGIEVGGNIETSATRSHSTQSVVVKAIQRMFTVSFADDLAPQPSDLFAPQVTRQEIETQGLGPTNLPMYVQSVTYGRVFFFSAMSDSVDSADELKLAINATVGPISGSVTATDRQRNLVSGMTVQIEAFGGPVDAVNRAITTYNWQEFFVRASALTAVPLSFKVRTVRDHQDAGLVYNIAYDERATCQTPQRYDMTIDLERVAAIGSGIISLPLFSWLQPSPGAPHLAVLMNGNILDNVSGTGIVGGEDITPYSWQATPATSITLESRVSSSAFQAFHTWAYPFPDWTQPTPFSRQVTVGAQVVRFDYTVQKQPVF